jgi:quinoprotein glucose dehydrogenase
VPQSNVPGERSAARQPFPTRPPPVSPQGVTLDDAFDLTPELKAAAQKEMQKYRLGPIFTPPSLEGSLVRPGPAGTVSWGGGSFDPETGMLYVKTSNAFGNLRMLKYDPATTRNPQARFADADWVGYELVTGSSNFANGLPAQQAAVCDAGRVRHEAGRDRVASAVWVWRRTQSASIRRSKAVTLPDRLGTRARRARSSQRRPRSSRVGETRRCSPSTRRPAGKSGSPACRARTTGTPMTYRCSKRSQFVLITTGSGSDQELMAFTLN